MLFCLQDLGMWWENRHTACRSVSFFFFLGKSVQACIIMLVRDPSREIRPTKREVAQQLRWGIFWRRREHGRREAGICRSHLVTALGERKIS